MKTAARILLLLSAAAAISAAGCYRKVVNARGPGADTMRIETPDGPSPEGRTLGYPRYQHKTLPGG